MRKTNPKDTGAYQGGVREEHDAVAAGQVLATAVVENAEDLDLVVLGGLDVTAARTRGHAHAVDRTKTRSPNN